MNGGSSAVRVTDAELRAAELQAIAALSPGKGEPPNAPQYLAILDDMLAAAIAHREGRLADAMARIEAAGTAYAALPVDFGPPIPLKPPHELAGEWLLAANRPAEALRAFDQGLQRTPRRTLSLLGRARSLAASGEADAAREAYAELAKEWANAEPDLPALAEVRAGAVASN